MVSMVSNIWCATLDLRRGRKISHAPMSLLERLTYIKRSVYRINILIQVRKSQSVYCYTSNCMQCLRKDKHTQIIDFRFPTAFIICS